MMLACFFMGILCASTVTAAVKPLQKCQSFQTKVNTAFSASNFDSELDMTSAEQCAIACYQAKAKHGKACQSAEFNSKYKDCLLFTDQATFKDDTFEYVGATYIYSIACEGAAAATTQKPAATTKPTPAASGSCGIANSKVSTKSGGKVAGRIIGGVDSNPHGWPWLVSVMDPGDGDNWQHGCGGSLIRLADNLEKTDVVITAEHCIVHNADETVYSGKTTRVPGSQRQVVAGEYDWNKNEGTEVTRNAKTIHSPGTGPPYLDIAIIILKEEIQFNKYIQPPCLPQSKTDVPPNKKMCVVTGWGSTDPSGYGQTPNLPKEVTVPITQPTSGNFVDMCASGKADICAGYKEGRKDSCSGDSGGPLNCELTTGKWTLVGAVSRSYVSYEIVNNTAVFPKNVCAIAGNPGFYSSTAYNLDWIKKTICAHSKFKSQIAGCQ